MKTMEKILSNAEDASDLANLALWVRFQKNE